MPQPLTDSDLGSVHSPYKTENDHEEENGERVRKQCDDIRNRCFDKLTEAARDTESAMTDKDVVEYMELALSNEGMARGGKTDPEEILKALEENLSLFIPRFVSETKAMGRMFLEQIASAECKEWISHASAERWRKRLKEHAGNWPTTRAFLNTFGEEYMVNWEKLHTDTIDMQKDVKKLKITEKEIPILKEINKYTFADENYHKKRGIVSEAMAALKVYKENNALKDSLYKKAQGMLKAAVSIGALSEHKYGIWMQRLFVHNKPAIEIARYMDNNLKMYIKNWTKVRYRYDHVEREMKKGKVPQGLNQKNPEQFLLMKYAQQLSYVEEAERRLQIERTQTKDTPIEDLKGKIRHAMDTEDWDEADFYLKKAWTIAQGEDIHELQSMERYLRAFRTNRSEGSKKNPQEEILKAHETIDQLMRILPEPLRPFYRIALRKGYGALQCLCKLIYNRTWCQDRMYLTEEKEQDLREQSVEETEERISISGSGHGPGLENNFAGLGRPAVRKRGKGPQNLFASSKDAFSIMEEADQNKNTYTFWYWTNLIVTGVNAAQNAYVSRNINWQFKRAMRTIEKYGGCWNPSFSS